MPRHCLSQTETPCVVQWPAQPLKLPKIGSVLPQGRTPWEGDHPSPEPPRLLIAALQLIHYLFINPRRDPADTLASPCLAPGLQRRCCKWERGQNHSVQEKDHGTGDRHCPSARSTRPAIPSSREPTAGHTHTPAAQERPATNSHGGRDASAVSSPSD